MLYSNYPFPTETTKWILYQVLYEHWKLRKETAPVTATLRVDVIHQ